MTLVQEFLDKVDYTQIEKYSPTEFAIGFVNFIKLIHGADGVENETPIIHYKMLDSLVSGHKQIATMIFRGAGKSTLMAQYLFFYLAVFRELGEMVNINYAMYVSDSIDNGVKVTRRGMQKMWENSEFLQNYLPEAKFTDIRWEFINKDGKSFVVSAYGAKSGVRGTRENNMRPQLCHKKGTYVCTDKGWHLVEDYPKKGQSRFEYGIEVNVAGLLNTETVTKEHRYWASHLIRRREKTYLKHGTQSKTYYKWTKAGWCEAQHLSVRKKLGKQKTKDSYLAKPIDMTIKPIPPLLYSANIITQRDDKGRVVKHERVWANKVHPIMLYDEFWWLYGLYLADGHSTKDCIGFTIANSQKHTVGKKLRQICKSLNLSLSKPVNKKGCYQVVFSDRVLARFLRENHRGNSVKNIPDWVLHIDFNKQKQLLLGYIAGDGYICFKTNQVRINSINQDCMIKLGLICERLGLPYHIRVAKTKEQMTKFPCGRVCKINKQYELRLKDNVKEVLGIPISPNTHERREVFIKDGFIYRLVKSVRPSDYTEFIPIETPSHVYTSAFGLSHNCVLDDLVSDDDARSPTVIESIKATVYEAVMQALHPKKQKIIWLGTPFNANDPLYEAVESGAWYSNVYPVCEKFPCSKEEFKGAWEDRFDYDYIKAKYDTAVAVGRVDGFYRELMLQIMSDDERLILDSDIQWYPLNSLLKNKTNFNFYITTDFATSEKESADYSFISVWAVNHQGNYFWVDGLCERQTMDKNIDALFRLVSQYQPLSVGVEVSGQQAGFIAWIKREMFERNIFFTLASNSKDGQEGLKPNTNKLERFNVIVPDFKLKRFYFPLDKKHTQALKELMTELSQATIGGFKSKHDDGLDTISQLGMMNLWFPSQEVIFNQKDNIWQLDEPIETPCHSYFV